jgi:hypothetical protein
MIRTRTRDDQIRRQLRAFYKATGDVRFSDAIAAMDQHGIERRRRGAPGKWRLGDLVRLWASVQAFIYDGKTASDACRFLVKGEGFGYQEAASEKKVVVKNARTLNRLYNMAEKLVSSNPQAAKEAERQKREFIFDRHPDNKKMGKQVERDRIQATRAFIKSLRDLTDKGARAKNRV